MTDPNADLVGMRFASDRGELVVVGTAPWSDAYMLCDGKGTRSARAVSLLRSARSPYGHCPTCGRDHYGECATEADYCDCPLKDIRDDGLCWYCLREVK